MVMYDVVAVPQMRHVRSRILSLDPNRFRRGGRRFYVVNGPVGADKGLPASIGCSLLAM